MDQIKILDLYRAHTAPTSCKDLETDIVTVLERLNQPDSSYLRQDIGITPLGQNERVKM